MAGLQSVRSCGSSSTTVLGGFLVGVDDLTPSTLALLQDVISSDLTMVNRALVGSARQVLNGAYNAGRLWVPGRGELVCRPGDFIGLDMTTFWPILLSADTIANGNWSHTGSL